jgi:hypothetical protein
MPAPALTLLVPPSFSDDHDGSSTGTPRPPPCGRLRRRAAGRSRAVQRPVRRGSTAAAADRPRCLAALMRLVMAHDLARVSNDLLR